MTKVIHANSVLDDQINQFSGTKEYIRKYLAGHKYVYFIYGDINDGMIKIGQSIDPHSRFNQLSRGYPFKMELIMTIPETKQYREARFHAAFHDARTKFKRTEWFTLTDELLDFIIAVKEGANAHKLLQEIEKKKGIREKILAKTYNRRYHY